MSDQTPDGKAEVKISSTGEKITIQIIADKLQSESDSWSIQAQKGIKSLCDQAGIKKVYYIDDIFEIIDNYPNFLGKIKFLIGDGKLEALKVIKDIDFELPEEARDQLIKKVWDENPQKRGIYLSKVIAISGEDPDFKKDLSSKNKIEEYFYPELLKTVSPSAWEAQKAQILADIPDGERNLFLFDNIFTHSPAPISSKKGLDFVVELIGSPSKDKVVCGLLTHTVKKDQELKERREMCKDKNIPIQHFFVLSKERSDRALQFADGIKKALLNSSCEVIKQKVIDVIEKAHKSAIEKLDSLDAYAFDHIIINSSFKEGLWEPETIFRINDFLVNDFASDLIVKDGEFRKAINTELEQARAIGRIEITNRQYNDHLSLRNQELYEPGAVVNGLNKPIGNGDIFQVENGLHKGKYVLVTQECDLMVRSNGERGTLVGTLIKIRELSEKSLLNEIQKYNKKDPSRQHYFSDKFKLPYFNTSEDEVKAGIVDFDKSVLIDMSVLDLAVFNSDGQCKIDCNNSTQLTTQFQSSWRRRFETIAQQFKLHKEKLDKYSPSIGTLDDSILAKEIWLKMMPTVAFIDGLVLNPTYKGTHFEFGIRRILRYRNPGSTLLLNRYTRHLSRDAEDHDFAN